jgi:hypothetical protein
VPLTALTPTAVTQHVMALPGILDDSPVPVAAGTGPADVDQQLTATLGWLWDAVAGPVLDHLEMGGPPTAGQPWPRLWWCLSGLLSFLPVHAAGHHRTRFGA